MKLETTFFERQAHLLGYRCVVGLDEAGRGPLAGPVVAAACYIPIEIDIDGIYDSKQLTADERATTFQKLTTHAKVLCGVGIIENDLIDQINILEASLSAMLIALNQSKIEADYLLVDGLIFPKTKLPGLAIAKGDSLSRSVSAASIIAKYTRDQIMLEHHERWPEYGFNEHKGYATKDHLEALEKHGPCLIHRMSFDPIKSWTNLLLPQNT